MRVRFEQILDDDIINTSSNELTILHHKYDTIIHIEEIIDLFYDDLTGKTSVKIYLQTDIGLYVSGDIEVDKVNFISDNLLKNGYINLVGDTIFTEFNE